jgi:hypothetical protein
MRMHLIINTFNYDPFNFYDLQLRLIFLNDLTIIFLLFFYYLYYIYIYIYYYYISQVFNFKYLLLYMKHRRIHKTLVC